MSSDKMYQRLETKTMDQNDIDDIFKYRIISEHLKKLNNNDECRDIVLINAEGSTVFEFFNFFSF